MKWNSRSILMQDNTLLSGYVFNFIKKIGWRMHALYTYCVRWWSIS